MTIDELKMKLTEALDEEEWELAQAIAEDIAHYCRVRELEIKENNQYE